MYQVYVTHVLYLWEVTVTEKVDSIFLCNSGINPGKQESSYKNIYATLALETLFTMSCDVTLI